MTRVAPRPAPVRAGDARCPEPRRRCPGRIRADRDRAASRGRADFRLLLMDLAMPADLFAHRLDADFRPVAEPLITTGPAGRS